MNYVRTPIQINTKDLVGKSYSLSPSTYRNVFIKNTNTVKLVDLLERPIKASDKGVEVGSQSYISKSAYTFIRTKGLQQEHYLPSFTPESTVPILPSSFKNYSLKKGDVLISKDSNIGEVIILDKDYPNHMISGGIYKLPLKSNKYYVFAIMKSNFFKTQLLFKVSRGATIKHAKTLFLDCEIPFPNNENSKLVVNKVENLVTTIISNEQQIIANDSLIENVINNELLNQCGNDFTFSFPNIKDIQLKKRLDTGLYVSEFMEIDYKLKNYKNGYSLIEPNKLKSGSTPKDRVIGKSSELKYLWITPTQVKDNGTIAELEKITCKNNNLNNNAMLVINRTSRGGLGEYVGIAMYYSEKLYGKAHHNQGIYRITGYSDIDLLFMTSMLNCKLLRKYCAGLSIGSKMKEMKAIQFLDIPIPNFPTERKEEIAHIYLNTVKLNEENRILKDQLEKIIAKIVNGDEITP